MRATLLAFILIALSSSLKASELALVWEGSPIPVSVQIDVEKRIDFPEAIASLDVPDVIRETAQIVLTPKGVLLLSASKELNNARLFATSVTGSVYIIDITASNAEAAPQNVSIVDPAIEALKERAERESKQQLPAFLTGEAHPQPPTLNYVEISRFALSNHIGPKRLVPDIAGASTIGIEQKPLTRFVRLNESIQVTPLQQWKVGSLYVTTLGVKNTGSETYQFDARGLRGNFLFAATASLTLDPTPLSRETVWSVISAKPFSVAVGEVH